MSGGANLNFDPAVEKRMLGEPGEGERSPPGHVTLPRKPLR